MFQALRIHDFRLLWGGSAVSALGTWLLVLAIPAHVLLVTGSLRDTGLTLAAQYLPVLILGPVAGVVTDRWDRRRLMIATSLFRAGAVAAMLLGTSPGRYWVLYGALIAESSAGVLYIPAWQARTPAIVGTGTLLSSANSLNALAEGAVRLIGGPLGGILLAAFGFRWLILADAVSYLASAAANTATSRPATSRPATSRPATSGPATSGPATSGPATSGPATSGPATSGPATSGPATSGPATSGPATSGPATSGPATSGPATSRPAPSRPGAQTARPLAKPSRPANPRPAIAAVARDLAEGARVLRGEPVARALLAVTVIYLAANAALSAMLIPLGVRHLGGSQNTGFVLSALGVGFLLAAPLLRAMLDRVQPRTVLALTLAATAAGQLVLFTSVSLVSALPAAVAIGMFGSMSEVIPQTAMQRVIPNAVLGRISAVFLTGEAAVGLLGAVAGPFLAQAVHLSGLAAVASLVTLTAAALAFMSVPRLTAIVSAGKAAAGAEDTDSETAELPSPHTSH